MLQRLTILAAVILSWTAVSCTSDVKTETGGPDIGTEEAAVTFALQMPAVYSSETATVDENLVKTLYVLSFKSGDGVADGAEVFDYSSLAYSVTDGTDTRYKTVGVTLLKKDYPQKLVLIANAKQAVEVLNLQSGAKTRDEVLQMLEFGRTGDWHSQMSEFIPIPMWGEAEDALTITDNTNRIGTIILTRMISRLDVVKESTIDDDLFTLNSVHLYNRLTNGRVAPNRASTHWDDTEYKAILPTMPSADSHKVKGPLAVDAVQYGTTMVMPTVYAFEAEAPDDGAAANATCLVIGGYFDGSGTESFYRVDFVDRDDQGNITGYKHLLRNHIYRINISDVYGSGHPTPDEAFDSKAVNMDADVKEWDEGSITDVVFDRDYMLGVSQTEYILPKNQTTGNLLIVTTDVPAGWEIAKVPADASWLDITSGTTGPANEKSEVYFDLEENDTGAERTVNLKVTAGRLSIIVKVTQGVNEKYSLELVDANGDPVESLLFTTYGDDLVGSATPQQLLTANWTPAAEACMVSYYTTGTYGLGFNNRTNPFTAEAVLYGGAKILCSPSRRFYRSRTRSRTLYGEKRTGQPCGRGGCRCGSADAFHAAGALRPAGRAPGIVRSQRRNHLLYPQYECELDCGRDGR
ncbi:MAG: BACON domain-containing protein [Rikenellaceae bacterium]|nr:BACON domain-containing protein [Rikenellaceae bacterium]